MKIQSWEHVDELIKAIGLRQIRRDRLEGTLNEQTTKAKEQYGPQIQIEDAEIARMEEQLAAWCEAHRDDMTQGKGGGLAWTGVFGKVAFRKCPPAITFTVKKVEKVIAALKARKLFNCVHTVEAPNKEIMAALDPETLAAVHAKKGAAEKFEVKPDYDEIPATEEAA